MFEPLMGQKLLAGNSSPVVGVHCIVVVFVRTLSIAHVSAVTAGIMASATWISTIIIFVHLVRGINVIKTVLAPVKHIKPLIIIFIF